MQTDFPSVDFHFVFAFTYCHLRVYKAQEEFIRKVLTIHKVEFLPPEDSKGWTEIDTRILTDLICEALPKILAEVGLSGTLATEVLKQAKIQGLRGFRG